MGDGDRPGRNIRLYERPAQILDYYCGCCCSSAPFLQREENHRELDYYRSILFVKTKKYSLFKVSMSPDR